MSYGSNGSNNNSTTNDSPSGGGGSSYSGNSYGTSKVIDYDKWGLGLSNVQTNTVENTSNRYVGGFSNVPVGNSNSDSLGFSRGGFSTTVVTDTSNHNIYTSNITSDGLYYDISDIGVSNNTGYWDGNTTQFKYYDTSFNKMTHISIGDGLGGTTRSYYNYNIWGRMITNFTGKVYFRIMCDRLGAIYISDTSFNAPSNGGNSDLSLNLHEGIECPTWADYYTPNSEYTGNTGTYDVVANKQYFIRILWGELGNVDYLYMWAESDSNRVYFPNQGDISNTLANYPVTNLTNGNVLFFSGEPLMSYYAPPGNYFPGETIPICARWYDKVSITTDPSLILHSISHTYKLEAGAGGRNGNGTTGQGVATANDTATGYQPTAAFDNTIVDQNDVWHSANSSFPHWLSFEFPNEKYITKYKIWTRTNAINLHAPKDWQLLGIRESQIGSISDFSYNVLSTYTIIDTQSNQTNWSQSITSDITNDINRKEYYVANPGYYKYYVLHITDSDSTNANYVAIGQLAYYSSPVKESVASLDVNNSGNRTNTLHFNYTVGEGENAVDLKVLGISGDISGSDGLPVGNGSGILSNVKILSNTSNVDTSASLLYAKTTAGTYKIGDTISIETGWSEPVNKNGTPDLSLNLSNGGTATYLDGSGTNILKFNYTVQRGQNTTDLQIVNISGDIRDQSGGAALTLDTPGTKLLAGGLTGLRGTGGTDGVASGSGQSINTTNRLFNGSFDGIISGTMWYSLPTEYRSSTWVMNFNPYPEMLFEFPTSKYITRYKIWCETGTYMPKAWTFRGVKSGVTYDRTDSGTYDVIDTRSGQTSNKWTQATTNSIKNDSSYNEYYVEYPGYYKQYILRFTESNRDHILISQVAYYGDDYPNNILMPNVNILTDIDNTNGMLLAGAGALRGTSGIQGDVSASDTFPYLSYGAATYLPVAAFDNNIYGSNDVWHSASSFPHWLSFEFPSEKYITKYKIWPRNMSTSMHTPKDWELRGVKSGVTYDRTDSGTYTIIDTQIGQTGWTRPSGGSSDIANDKNRKEYYVANPGYYKYYVLDISSGSDTVYEQVTIAQLAYYGYNLGTEVQLVSVSAPDKQYKEGDKIPITATWIKDVSYSGDVSLNLSNGMIVDISDYGLDYHKNSLVFNYVVGSNSNEPTPNLSVLSYSGNIYDPSLVGISAEQVTGDLGSAKYGVIIRKPNDKTDFVHKASYTTNQLASLSTNDAEEIFYDFGEIGRLMGEGNTDNNLTIFENWCNYNDFTHNIEKAYVLSSIPSTVATTAISAANTYPYPLLWHSYFNLGGGTTGWVQKILPNYHGRLEVRYGLNENLGSVSILLNGGTLDTTTELDKTVTFSFKPNQVLRVQENGGSGSATWWGIVVIYHIKITKTSSYGINEEKRPNNVKIDNSYAFVGDHLYDRGTGRILVYELSYNPVDKADNYIVYHKIGVKSLSGGNKFVIDNDISNTPYFYAGQRYRFDQSDPSNLDHRILFGYDSSRSVILADPSYDISYGTPGQSGAYTEFTPKKDGKAFYISCQNHSNMGSLYNGIYGIKILTREFWNFHSAIYGDSEGAYLGKNIDIDMANNRIIASNGKGSQDLEYLAAGAGALNGTGGLQGDASASSVYNNTTTPAIDAFNGTIVNNNDCWHSTASIPQWLSFEFPTEKYITKYKIWSRDHNDNLQPNSWKLLGIRDGVITDIKSNFNYNIDSSYTVIDTRSNQTSWVRPTETADITNDIKRNEYYVTNPGYYKYYVLHITDIQNSYVAISELAYYANDYPYGGANIYKLNANDTWSIDASNLIGDLSNNNPNMGLYPYGQLGYNGDVAIDSSYAIISTKRGEDISGAGTVFPQGIAYTYELSTNGDWLLDGSLSDIIGPSGGFGASIDVDAKTKRLAIGSTTRNEILLAGAGALDGSNIGQGDASASDTSTWSGATDYQPTAAFDNTIVNQHDVWHSTTSPFPHWLSFEFPSEKYITKYKIWGRNNADMHAPKDWQLQGVKSGVTYDRTDNETYYVIDTRSNQTNWQQSSSTSIQDDLSRNEYYVTNPGYYKQYVLHITSSSDTSYVAIGQLAYYGYENDGEDAVYTYDYSGVDMSGWVFDQSFNNGDASTNLGSGFGSSVVLDASTLIVTAPYLSDYDSCYVKTNNEKGAAYVFELSGVSGNWEIDQSFNGDDISYSNFGYGGVALDGSFLLTSDSSNAYIYERLSNSNGDTSFNFDQSFNNPIDTNSSNFGNSLALKGNNAIFSDGQNTVFYKNYSFSIIADFNPDASAAYDPIPGRTLPGTTDPSYIYYIGDVLDIYMRWTNPVFVIGQGSEDEFGTYEKAYLNLSNDASALYYSGSGTNTLIFRYNVGQDDLSSTDLSINNYDVSLTLGGSIESSTGDAAEQPYSASGEWGKFKNNKVIIDTESLALVDIEYVPNTYLAGEYFDISLTFSKKVYTSGEDSSLILSGDISAAYEDGSGTDTITYRYYVPITYAYDDPSYNTNNIDISHQIDVSLIDFAGKGITMVAGNYDSTNIPISFLQQNLTGLNIDPIRPGFREFNTSSSTTDASNLSSESGVIYRIGDVIDISGTWTEELSCVVTPNYGVNNRDVSSDSAYLNLSNDASAIAVSRDISTILFKYIVTDGCGNDWKSNDDQLGIKAINYGGIITDIYGNPARGRDIDSSLAFLNITTVKTGSPYLNLEVIDVSGIFVDNSLPTFVDISYQPLTNTAPDPSYVYGIGDTIDISLTFNEPVWGQHSLFTRDASLCLSNDASAEIFAGSGTTILKFRYTVQEGDTDVCLNSLDLSIIAIDGSICDIARHDFSYINESGYIYPLDNSSILKNVRVKGTRTMDFLDISYNPNRDTSYNYYKVYDNIDISLVFNEQVWSYDAKLLLSNDSSAICIDGSGTNVLKFRYTVSDGGKDMSLNDLSIVAIDGSICDIGKNDLSYIYQKPNDNGVSIQLLMDASSDLSGVRVDSNIPTISDVSYVPQSTIPKYYGIGDNIDISLTFSEPVYASKAFNNVVSDASLLLSNDASAQLIAGSGTNILTFRYTVQEGDKDSSAIDLSITEYDGCLCDVGGNELVKTNTFDFSNINKFGDKIRLDANYPQLTDISYHETGVAAGSDFPGGTNEDKYTVYGIGNHLDISLTFNEHVYSHDASLTLTDTNQDFSARCIDGSGTNTLTFRYVVKEGDGNNNTREPDTLQSNWGGLTTTNDISIIGIDGSICDVGLNNMIDGLPNGVKSGGNFLDPSNIANKNIYIVGDRLAIVSYDFSTGSYGKNSSPQSNGQNGYGNGNGYIDISVNFSKEVYVTRTNTDISLCLSNDAKATYISGSGEKALQFRYHLKDDTSHNDTDNLQVYNIDFDINDASVNNTNGVDGSQVLLWTYKHNSKLPGIVIDHTPPTIVDICYNPATYNAGGVQNSNVDISINFSENVWSTDAKLLLSTGVSAECIDGSGTNILKFRYTVGKEKDGDDNFIEQYTGGDISIVDFTGKIRDLAQNDFSKNSDFNGGIQANAFAFTGSGELTDVIIIPEAIAVTALIQSSTPVNIDGSNNYYGIDDVLDIKLIFNKNVYYTSSTIPGLNYPDPSLILSNDASATLIGYGDTSSILLFQYTINEGDKSADDLRIKGYDGSINHYEDDLSKGEQFEHLGNDDTNNRWSGLEFKNSSVTNDVIQTIIIDTSYLSLNGIDCSASTYKIGDFVDISFIFSEPVKVITNIDTINGGTYPKLVLNVKNTESDLSCVANYHSGHDTSGIKFRYFPAYYDQNSPDDSFNLQIDDISYGPNFDASIVDFANNPIRYPPLFRYIEQQTDSTITDLSLIGIKTITDFPKFLGIDVSAGKHLGTYKPRENVYITTTWDRPIDICKNIVDAGELKLEFSNYLTSYRNDTNAEREKATFFAKGKWSGGNNYSDPKTSANDIQVQIVDNSYSLIFKYNVPDFTGEATATNAGMKTFYRDKDDKDIKIRQFLPYEAIYDVSFNAHSAEQIFIDCGAGFPIYKPNEQDIAEASTTQPGRPALRNVPRWDIFGNCRCAGVAFNNVKGATSSSNSAKKTASARITLGGRGK